ncbi:beta-1,3-glucanase family protein [Rhodococcus marinonascens]|uniref:beta-1,3-glucanase family protein n=1 Tax=Rhodococcus marinonascens TaxID=38311 RepID=UPI00093520AB|nr:beta-1,3-glucanase family protein [Rhodococcus marinonascens]
MLSRRAFLGSALGAVALGAPILSSVAPALTPRARAATTLRTKVVNATGTFGNSAIKMYIPGEDLATGQQGFVNASGVFVPVPQDAADGTVLDLAIPMSNTGDTDFVLPQMSGRIYFAIDGDLAFKAVVDEHGIRKLQYPAGWVESDDSYSVMYDWMEFTLDDAGMHCNNTMVDSFCLPSAIRLEGAASQTSGELVPGGRERIFSAIARQPDHKNLIIGDNLRVISPGHGIDAGLFPADYFDEYINEVWKKYATTDLLVTNEGRGVTYTGRVEDEVLVFDKGVAPIPKPTTRDVFYCDGALVAPNDGLSGPVAAIIGSAFNRGTLLDHSDQPISDPKLFYKPGITNHYSRIMHENTVTGKAYGFAFDDVGAPGAGEGDGDGFSTLIQDANPSSCTITLTDLSSGPVPGGTDPGTGGGTTPSTGGGTDPNTGGGTNPGPGGVSTGSTGLNFGS